MKNNPLFDKDYRDFLVLFKKARLDSGLTQVQVGKLLKKPHTFVSKCEQGERRIDAIELSRFAKIYNKPIDWFIPK